MAAQPETQSLPPGAKRTSDRLGFKYRFDDPDMDLFFVIACGWGRAGGLDIGEAYHVHFRGIEAFAQAPPAGGIVEVRRFGGPEDPRSDPRAHQPVRHRP